VNNQPTPSHFWRWFDPRHHQAGTWAFILNRITALGLTLYLTLHLFALSQLASGPETYDAFIKLAKTPVIKGGEMLVIAAGIIHGLNGIRIGLNSFGIGVRIQKQIFAGLMAVAVIGILVFAVSMFGGA
jgi:succinate dehydrogenase / fumarate reductase cytochrome b subunit